MLPTTVDNQVTLQIAVYEGERALVKDCHLLGQFDLNGIHPAPKGQPQIMVTFDIDESGIVKVTAEDKASKVKGDIEITVSYLPLKSLLLTEELSL